MCLPDMEDRQRHALAQMADTDRLAVRIQGRDHVRERGKPRALAVVDRHVLVHHMQHEIALVRVDGDGADVEGAFGVADGLASYRSLGEDRAGRGRADRVDHGAAALPSAVMMAWPSSRAREMPPSAACFFT